MGSWYTYVLFQVLFVQLAASVSVAVGLCRLLGWYDALALERLSLGGVGLARSLTWWLRSYGSGLGSLRWLAFLS